VAAAPTVHAGTSELQFVTSCPELQATGRHALSLSRTAASSEF